MDVAFKLATVADVSLLVELMREFYRSDAHLTFNEQAVQSSLQLMLKNDSLGRIWLIQINGSAVGYVTLTLGFSLEFHGRDAFIDEIYVRAEHRGQGIATSALEFVEDTCRLLGVRALHLEVGRKNTNAQDVYRKFGFEDHDQYLMTKMVQS